MRKVPNSPPRIRRAISLGRSLIDHDEAYDVAPLADLTHSATISILLRERVLRCDRHLPYCLQQSAKIGVRSDAHGSIRIEEGQPPSPRIHAFSGRYREKGRNCGLFCIASRTRESHFRRCAPLNAAFFSDGLWQGPVSGIRKGEKGTRSRAIGCRAPALDPANRVADQYG
jgi:hypothetical protein